jgi:transposase
LLRSRARQSDIQALHRARERLVSERTALINHLRALLLERGIVAPQGRRKLEEQFSTFADEDGIEALSPRIRLLIEDLRAEWRALDERIAVFDKEFVQMARNEEPVRRLVTIPGIGTINATALVAAVGNARAFRRGRDMAAWLGLTPRQMTTGGKPRLLGISKRGNRYLRKNVIHGARAVLPYLVEQKTPLGRWTCGLLARRTRMLSLLRWPTSWRALPGWSWRVVVSTTPATKRWPHRGEIARGVPSRRRVSEVCAR